MSTKSHGNTNYTFPWVFLLLHWKMFYKLSVEILHQSLFRFLGFCLSAATCAHGKVFGFFTCCSFNMTTTLYRGGGCRRGILVLRPSPALFILLEPSVGHFWNRPVIFSCCDLLKKGDLVAESFCRHRASHHPLHLVAQPAKWSRTPIIAFQENDMASPWRNFVW